MDQIPLHRLDADPAAENPAQPVLRFAGARCARGERTVLDGLDLTIPAGEIYVLLGGNGAGKSTALMAACGRLRLTDGMVDACGADPARDAAARRRIGLMPQGTALYSNLTVRENLEVFARYAGVPSPRRAGAVAEALDLAGLTPVADARLKTLSGGFQRRASLAVTILPAPALVLLDEPSTGMDVGAIDALVAALRALRERGAAVLMTTHDLDLADSTADRVGFLVQGRIALEGPPDRLIRDVVGARLEVSVALRHAPDAAEIAVLRAAGYSPGGRSRIWSLVRAGELGWGAAALNDLRAAGLEIEEMRERAAGLRALFTQIVGDEPEGAP